MDSGVGKDPRRHADVALGVLLLAIVALMIVPLPTVLLDLLIASNLAIAVVMLLLAMAIPDGLAFTAMPTVLLVTTLFRLSLNVSSTRLILLQADAGQVIRAFGEYVVAGNYAVGAVVFAILTLVQYVVVARGAERVAEVSARFTLDAMPGKQMAIDADLRAGALSVEAARVRRRHLEREGQFYGAMDGAMKFVKGDAIAGIAITFINLFAGAGIGVAMRGLSLRESLTTYGLLTVGDGLACQIPSLLIATSAGLVVTRVASGDERASLGHDVSAQLFGNPRVLAMGGGFLLLLALLPGLPALPFAALAAALLAGSAGVRRTRAAAAQRGAWGGQDGALPELTPLALELDPELHAALEQAPEAPLRAALERARSRLSLRLGMPWPALSIARADTLARGRYRVALYTAPVEERALADAAPAEQAEVLARALERIVAAHAGELFGLQEAQTLLHALERTAPALVRDSVPKPVSLRLLTDVLRCLLAERISVRPFAPILETVAAAATPAAAAHELAERARVRLARQITAAHARDGVIAVHLLDPLIEDTLRDALPTRAGGPLALPPDQARDIVAAVRHAGATVLLTQLDLRRHLRKLLEVELPDVAVLSFPELDPDTRVERRTPIRIGAAAPAPRAQATQ